MEICGKYICVVIVVITKTSCKDEINWFSTTKIQITTDSLIIFLGMCSLECFFAQINALGISQACY